MTVCSSTQRKKRKMSSKIKLQRVGDHDEFLNRITKTLYYGKFPITDRFSLPVSELAAELFSEAKNSCSLDRLHVDDAAEISRNACVSPCSLVLALLYLERLKTCNSEYVEKVAPSELFLVSMMVASKFLHDDGEDDEVFNDEWATSGGIELKDMNQLEREFLDAINWEVYVSEAEFWTRLRGLESVLALRQGRQRGWFSYTELTNLVHAMELASLAHTLITVSAVCLTSYTASVLAMVGSTLVVNQLPSLATSIVSSSSPLLPLPATTPLTVPDSCLTANRSMTQLDIALWNKLDSVLEGYEKDDVNHSSEDTGLTPRSNSFLIKRNDWTEQKDWLAKISDLVKMASTNSHPSMIIPVEIISF